MNKSKLAVGLMTALLSVGTLAGCDNSVKYSSDGKIITYKDGNSDSYTLKADELLKKYYKDSSKYQTIFDAINSIVVRNYFTIEDSYTKKDGTKIPLGAGQMKTIENDASRDVEKYKKEAQIAANNNGTSYQEEFDKTLSSNGVKNERELWEKFVEDNQKKTFEDNFYTYYIDDVKKGDETLKYKADKDSPEKQLWNGYFKDMVPYHVSHILVELADTSGNNYSSGTISKENAEKLYNVVNALKNHKDNFKTIANQFSDDTGSADHYGDLGIVDTSTSFINEFKLSLYAYENFVGNTDAARASKIKIPGNESPTKIEGIAGEYLTEVENAFGDKFPEVDFSVFEELKNRAEEERDNDKKAVIDNSATFYPRNIIYNKYLNRHSFAFITSSKEADEADETASSGFHKYKIDGVDRLILSVKTATGWTPVLAVRGESLGKQGIFFIIVNRSPFVTSGEGIVDLNDYYTTFYPKQDDYPKDENGKLATYINFWTDNEKETKDRAEAFVSTLKSYDSDRLNKYIYKRFFKLENLKINDAEIEEMLDTWIYRGIEKKEEEREDAWENTWNEFLNTLRKQNADRTKLVSEACKIAFLNGNKKDAISVDDYKLMVEFLTKEGKDVNYIKSKIGGNGVDTPDVVDKDHDGMTYSKLFKEEGGLCNDGKSHN